MKRESDYIRVLCYGDSNTWGTIGRWEESDLPSLRYEPEKRWTHILQKELGGDYCVLEEGLGGRTTIYAAEGGEWKCGETCLKPALHTHRPLDWVVIMLGTNDLQVNKQITAEDLPVGISRLVDIVQASPKVGRDMTPPQVLILAPVEVQPSDPRGRTAVYAKFRHEIGRELSLLFPEVYSRVAAEKQCHFLNAQDYAVPGPADGVHLDEESHLRLGKAIAAYLKEHPTMKEEVK